MWGIVPAAGRGSRIQPLAFSKELLPIGSRRRDGVERPCAVSEYLVERMIEGGVTKLCFVISAAKCDIVNYYGSGYGEAAIVYRVQPRASGLCDAIFQAVPLIPEGESVIVGLPDTVWFPTSALCSLPDDILSFLLFPVGNPSAFDAVLLDEYENVLEIMVKRPEPDSNWVWGAFKLPGPVFHALHRLWLTRDCKDEFIGTLVNAYLREGGHAKGVRAGRSYVDVGTLNGYRAAINLLAQMEASGAPAPSRQAALTPEEIQLWRL